MIAQLNMFDKVDSSDNQITVSLKKYIYTLSAVCEKVQANIGQFLIRNNGNF